MMWVFSGEHTTIVNPHPGLQGRWLLMCGAGSGVLHVVVYATQRVIHHGPAAGKWTFPAALLAYFAATGALFTLYALVLAACQPGRGTRRTQWLVLLIPVLFCLLLIPAPASMSIDIYSYVAHGHVMHTLNETPYKVGARAVADLPLGHTLAQYGWRPVHGVSPYGPALTHLEHAVVAVTPNVRVQILLFKAMAVGATITSAAIIWMLLGWLRPNQRLLGTAVFLWNPMVVWELAGDGHNDAVMILFVLLAIALIVRQRHLSGIIALAGAVLTKYVPLMLVPLAAVYSWRTAAAHRDLLGRAAIGATIAAGMAVVLFFPLWDGFGTFRGVRVNGAPGVTGSTATMVLEVLGRIAPQTNWDGFLWGISALSVLVCVTWQARRVTGHFSFLRAVATVWLLYTLLISPTYWPWYAAPVVALVALVPDPPFLRLAFAVSLGSRLAAPLSMLFVHELLSRPVFLGSVWILGVGLPLLVLALHAPVLRGNAALIARRFNDDRVRIQR